MRYFTWFLFIFLIIGTVNYFSELNTVWYFTGFILGGLGNIWIGDKK